MTKLFIASPLYGGHMRGEFHMSVLQLQDRLMKKGIDYKFGYRFNESLITRARNKIAKRFLDSGYDGLLKLDSDISFRPDDPIRMIELSESCPGIMCAPYAKKGIDWERIARVSAKRDKYPLSIMSKVGSNPCANFLHPNISFTEPTEVRHSGTGYMYIPRYVFEALDSNPNVLSYKLTDLEKLEMGCDRLTAYFESKVWNDEYPSEDWWFCDRYRETGGKVWLCGWMTSEHYGEHPYPMDLPALASTGEELT